MNKKLMALPTMALVVSMLGASVFAATSSPVSALLKSATGKNGENLFNNADGKGSIVIVDDQDDQKVLGKKATDLISAADITSAVNNSKFDAAKFEIVKTFDAHYEDATGTPAALPDDLKPVTVDINFSATDTEAVLILHYENGAWKIVGKSVAKAVSVETFEVSDLSPFAIAKASATTSAQTGEYAGTYIIMVAVALVAAGAVFAIRAKKASN